LVLPKHSIAKCQLCSTAGPRTVGGMSLSPSLFAAGLLAGAMNALAGGGSFVTLPALIAVGLPSVQANASSTVALWPGGAASAWTYHERFRPICGVAARSMMITTLSGGLAGSLLLLWTPSAAFNMILPWLLLLATLALAFGRRIGAAWRRRQGRRTEPVLIAQFGLGLYGGYFGGAVGLMMVATWTLLGEGNTKALNAPRTLCGGLVRAGGLSFRHRGNQPAPSSRLASGR
jgi:uncharacterized protein